MKNPRWLVCCCALAALAAPLAHAQYSWIDAKGTRVFSDRPPPPGTPASKILKAPRGAMPYAEDVPVPAAEPAKKDGPPTLADREADYRKRTAARAEDQRKADETAQRKAAAAERCQDARAAQADLASGRRVVRTTASGEQEYLSDEERARQLEKARRVLAECN